MVKKNGIANGGQIRKEAFIRRFFLVVNAGKSNLQIHMRLCRCCRSETEMHNLLLPGHPAISSVEVPKWRCIS